MAQKRRLKNLEYLLSVIFYKIYKFLCIESEGQSKRLIVRPYWPQGDKSCLDQNWVKQSKQIGF